MSNYYRSPWASREITHLPTSEIEGEYAKNRAFRFNIAFILIGFVFLAVATFVISPWLDSFMPV